MNSPRLPRLIASNAPKHDSTLLTIAIPSYMHSQYIDECLSGVLSCSEPDKLELVLIDDCSSDDTIEKAIALLSNSDLSYRAYQNETNQGLVYGLSFLLDVAQGEYFLPCASDDAIIGPSLSHVIKRLQMNRGPSSFEVYGAQYIGSRKGPVYDARRLAKIFSDTETTCKWLSSDFPKPLLLQSTVFNTEFLRQVDPWSDRLILDDWPTFLRASLKASAQQLPIQFTPEIELTAYRVHDAGLHANLSRQREACLEVVEKVVPSAYKQIARAQVLSACAVADLAEGRPLRSLEGYVRALASYPSFGILLGAPLAVAAGIVRRLNSNLRPMH